MILEMGYIVYRYTNNLVTQISQNLLLIWVRETPIPKHSQYFTQEEKKTKRKKQ